MDEIVGLLEGLGYEARKVGGGDPSADAFRVESARWSRDWLATGDSKPALIIWSGHAVRVDDQTRLALSDLESDDPRQWKNEVTRSGVTTDQLVNEAEGSGAEHVLMIIDTCYAGGGAVSALEKALKRSAEETAPPGHGKWFGFLASCRGNEVSDGNGPLLAALAKVLKEGPAGKDYRSAWSDHNAFVSGPDLMKAIATQWDGEGQTPVSVTTGDWRPAFPNPLHSPEAPARLVEHLVQAARGVGHREEGWFFTGRTRVLGRIVEWLDEDAPGLFLVTGPAGCGKSAVLGRIATLADPEQRARAVESGALRDGDPDPGVRAERTLAAVHLRDLTPLQAAERLAHTLRLPRPRSTDDFRAEVRELSPQPVLVMDGLDEVPAEHTQSMIEELVFPLSRSVPVLLGSRERVFRSQQEGRETLPETLARLIGADVTTVDLEDDPHTREDIGEYVRRRCEAAGITEGLAREAGAAIAERATDVGGGFLFARLVTSTVLARAASGEDGSLLTELPDSIDAAFENELRAVPARVRDDGTVLPSAAWDLLAALAWTVGQGMPAGGVWEAVAGALGGGVEYDETDVDWALTAFGRYIVEDAEEGQAVYRLYHREFVAHLRRRDGPGGTAAGEVVLRTLVGLVKRQGRVGDWSGVDPYVMRGLVAHAVGCGGAGVGVLRGVAAWDEQNGSALLSTAVHTYSAILAKEGQREEALCFAREAVDLLQKSTDAGTRGHMPSLASALNGLANRLAAVGEHQAALAPAHEAVRIRRTLADQHPGMYLPHLASALSNLANHLSSHGDRRAALASAHEAVRIRRTLAQQHPATHLSKLAGTLNNLANRLAETGDHPGAVTAAREATDLYRTLGEHDPASHLPEFAGAINNLANHLADVGQHAEALTNARQAVRIRRALAEQHPAAYRPHLATSLNNLANRLAKTADAQEGLTVAHEATVLYRALAEQHPAVFVPELATSLSNLAAHLADNGDLQGTLAPAQEAVALSRTLAEENPAAHLPNLANSLNNISAHFAKNGRLQDALTAVDEAVAIRRVLAEQHPAAFLPDLAGCLNNLANRLAETGEVRAALAPAQEATDLYRTLAERHPAAYASDLAGALNNLANHLTAAGHYETGLAFAREAVSIQRTLADQHPAAHLPDLAGALNNLANHLATTGRHPEALTPAQEATDLYRALADQHPAAHLPDLAGALNNLANHLATTGSHPDALTITLEAVRIRRTLAVQHPAAFASGLAASLRTLALRLADTSDFQGALAAAQEAADLYGTLTEQHPAHLPNLVGALNELAEYLTITGDPSAASRVYADAIADLDLAQPTAARILALERDVFLIRRPEYPTAPGLVGLFQLANSPVVGAPDRVALRARDVLRAYAQTSDAHSKELIAAWQQESARQLPDWLTLSRKTLNAVTAWLSTPTWFDSYVHWCKHAELLCSPEAACALDEFALLDPESAAHHQALRRRIFTEGAPAVYRPLILGEQLADWTALTTWDESEQYLRAHPDLLELDPPDSVPGALLHAARAHDIPTAYALVRDRTALQQYVQDALTSGDAEALRHAASIEDEVYGDQLSARTHHQAALLLADTPEDADPDSLVPLVADAPPDVRHRLISETAALSAAHATQHAARWVRIIQALATTR
ncbi:tetratricopeptide repeat protein [Streptomyces sp. SID7909]|uniref:tetratricopeptide repeat protein n=1 Tax=Streptomyces sp. SID7909 TaxID=2706092 RepID=UPI001EF2DA71|nr:tetratricopeptide repeat protein [Streptomyces sp. SID7909]